MLQEPNQLAVLTSASVQPDPKYADQQPQDVKTHGACSCLQQGYTTQRAAQSYAAKPITSECRGHMVTKGMQRRFQGCTASMSKAVEHLHTIWDNHAGGRASAKPLSGACLEAVG